MGPPSREVCTAVKVTVFSDYICPFCFVAAARLERLSQEVPLEVV